VPLTLGNLTNHENHCQGKAFISTYDIDTYVYISEPSPGLDANHSILQQLPHSSNYDPSSLYSFFLSLPT
jgi:hypothetical protein